MRGYIPALVALLALSACGGGDSETSPATGSLIDIAGDVAGAAAGNASTMGVSTADLPDFVELPKGGRAIQNTRVASGGQAGGTLTVETSQTPADLVAFYRESMAEHGLKIGLENETPQMVQLLGESEDKSKTLMVMVMIDDDGQVSVNLTHSHTIS